MTTPTNPRMRETKASTAFGRVHTEAEELDSGEGDEDR